MPGQVGSDIGESHAPGYRKYQVVDRKDAEESSDVESSDGKAGASAGVGHLGPGAKQDTGDQKPAEDKEEVDPAKTQVEAWLERGPEMANQDGSDGEGAQRIELIDMLAAALAQRTERSDRQSKGSLMNGGRVRAAGARCRPAGGLR
jgi:hypothetical protein